MHSLTIKLPSKKTLNLIQATPEDEKIFKINEEVSKKTSLTPL